MPPEPSTQGSLFPPEERERIQALIAERIQDFDVPALLDVLARLGYSRDDVEFRSHRSQAHQPQLLHSIQFVTEPHQGVVVTGNLGLLAVQTPLPSFFFQRMHQLDQDMMEDFLGFFDDVLLRERFKSLTPERDESLLPGWSEPESLVDRLTLLRLSSPSSLHWLVAKVFPEAEVLVRREPRRQRVDAPNLLLGYTVLGEGPPMGGYSLVPMTGLEVWIYLDEAVTDTAEPWAEEAQRRLSRDILPLLREMPLPLTVFLVLRELHGYARIDPRSYVGFDPIIRNAGPKPAQDSAEPPKVIILFQGLTSESEIEPAPSGQAEKLTRR